MIFCEGQSVGVLLPGPSKGAIRVYSIACQSTGDFGDGQTLSLCVKRVPGGQCSNFLCDLRPGAEVRLTGPVGRALLPPADPRAKVLMISTGTGVAPFRAFLQSCREGKGEHWLVHGSRSPESALYPLELAQWRREGAHVSLAFSQPHGQYVDALLWAERARVAEWLAGGAHVYICGLKAMEADVLARLRAIWDEAGRDGAAELEAMRREGRLHIETY